MKRFATLLILLVVMQQTAAAQAPGWVNPPDPDTEELLSQWAKKGLSKTWCGTLDKGEKRDECERAVEACAAPGSLLGFDVMCMRILQASSVDALCAAPEVKNDKVACLERRVEVLTNQLAALTRNLPRLIDESVKRALEPRLHR